MPSIKPLLLLCVVLLCAGCGSQNQSTGPEDAALTTVTLATGQQIHAEVEVNPVDLQKGMMYRDSLPQGRGMLFIHRTPGLNPYWMYNCRIPLDIIWMDSGHRIVEISPDTPPCKTKASLCPTYGGHETSQYVLELGGGEAKRLGVTLGQTLQF